MKTSESRESIAKQLSRIDAEFDRLRSILQTFDPSLPPDKVSADWVRGILDARRRRERVFPQKVFSDTGWDMLLELYWSHLSGEPLFIADLCRSIGIPGTTGLRWVGQLEQLGLVARTTGEFDRKRVFVKLSPAGLEAMTQYFQDPQYSSVGV